ncbi:MAG: hypothetical protein ACOYEV_10575 [Candidatus Nanopelagicales bacterium]
MQLSGRSSLSAGFTAAVVAAGAIVVAPQAAASVPRPLTAAVTLAAASDFTGPITISPITISPFDSVGDLFESTSSAYVVHPFDTVGDLFESTTSVYYDPDPLDAPAVLEATGAVSHPMGLFPELLADAMNPPILKAILGQQMSEIAAVAPRLFADLAAFGPYVNAAMAVVGMYVTTAVMDTVAPAQWGGGKVLHDWVNVGIALQAMTIGIGATVDGTWVPSLRVAAISTRNQIANDITGGTTSPGEIESPNAQSTGSTLSNGIGATTSTTYLETPNYAAYYTPVGCANGNACAVLPVSTTVGCGGDPNALCAVAQPAAWEELGACGEEICRAVAEPAASQRAATTTARNAAHVALKSAVAAAPKTAAARTRSAR